MRLIIRSVLSILLVVPVVGSVASAHGPSDPFKGAWKSTDAFDDSNQTLRFGGSGTDRRASLFDDDATLACDPDAPASLRGPATISGMSAEVMFEGRCARTGQMVSATVTYTYDPASNTLTDEVEVDGVTYTTIWHRPSH